MDLTNACTILQGAIGVITPAAQLVVRVRGDVVFSEAFGWLDPETRACPTQRDALFDMASVSKLFTVTALMTLVEEGRVALDTPISAVLPEFSGLRPVQPYEDPLNPGQYVAVYSETSTDRTEITESAPVKSIHSVDAARVTFHDLLTHTSGLPAWRPLYREPSIEAARQMALNTFFSYPTGTQVVYSDIGLILLGMAIERLTGQTLDAAVRSRVTAPLELHHTGYLPEMRNEKWEMSDGTMVSRDSLRISHYPLPISDPQSPIPNPHPSPLRNSARGATVASWARSTTKTPTDLAASPDTQGCSLRRRISRRSGRCFWAITKDRPYCHQ